MKWFSHPAAALLAAASMTALTSADVCAASPQSRRKGSHNTHSVSRVPARANHIVLHLQFSRDDNSPSNDINSPPVPLSRGESIARSALAYRGMPYRFGGRSARYGFDCSGLVQTVCAKWGFYLPRVAGAQFARGTPVTPDRLQPGDLVFFKNTYKSGLSHVGIYIGEGQFVHAAGYKQGVKINALAEAFYRQHWAGARRLDLNQLPQAAEESAFVPPEASHVPADRVRFRPARKSRTAWKASSHEEANDTFVPVDEIIAGEGTTTGRHEIAPHAH